MGIITEYVETTVATSNCKRYETLGYDVPKRKCPDKYRAKSQHRDWCYALGEKMIVKVKDLTSGSAVIIDYECDNCNKLLYIPYSRLAEHSRDGKYYCRECALQLFNSKENHPMWRSELTDEHREHNRNYPEYTAFVKKVIARDNHTCQCCKKECNHNAEVHHLDGYDWCIEKRTDETNGITLCENCHKNFHMIYGYGCNTKEQYEEWIGYTLENLTKYDGVLSTTRKIYCYEENRIYESATEFMETNNLKKNSSIYRVCNHVGNDYTVCGFHIFWLDEYEKMTDIGLKKHLIRNSHNKSVICITTGLVFNAIIEAKKYYGLRSRTGILNSIKNNAKTCRISKIGKTLWMYYSDFLDLTKKEQQRLLGDIKVKELLIDAGYEELVTE